MGINFYLGKSKKDILPNNYFIMPEELIDYLYIKNDLIESDLLIDLDPYGDKVFQKDEIKKLINVAEYYLSESRLDDFDALYDRAGNFREGNPFDVTFFFRKLLEFCNIALREDLNIMALGD